MVYAPTGLKLLVAGMGGGPAIFYYSSDDAHGAVDAADYFSDALEKGMKVGDIVLVADIDTGTTTLHHCSEVDADGNGTITAGTFS